jgi:hypothetical protein
VFGFKMFPTAGAHLSSYLTDLTKSGLTLPKIGLAAAAAAVGVPQVIFLATGEAESGWGWVVPAAIALLMVLLIEGYRLQELAIIEEMDRQDADIAGWEV